MGWGAEFTAFAVAGALFLLCAAAATIPQARARRLILVASSIAAAVFIAAAFLRKSVTGFATSPWAWIVTVVPLILLAVLGRRIVTGMVAQHRRARRNPPMRTNPAVVVPRVVVDKEAQAARLRIAQDPATSATELADLAYSHSELRVTIAANPSTPANVLGWLASNGGEGAAQAIARRSGEDLPPEAR